MKGGYKNQVTPTTAFLVSDPIATDLMATDILETDTLAITPLAAVPLMTVSLATVTNLALFTSTFVPPTTTTSETVPSDWYLGDHDISCGSCSSDALFPAWSIAHHPFGYTTIREITDKLDSPTFLQTTVLLKKSHSSSYIQRVSQPSTVELHPPKASLPTNKGSPDLFEKVNLKENHFLK